MTSEQAAKFLQVSKSFLYQGSRAGRIPAMKMGRTWRYSRKALEQWIDENMKGMKEAS